MIRGSAASQKQMGTGGWGPWRDLLSLVAWCINGTTGSTAARASENRPHLPGSTEDICFYLSIWLILGMQWDQTGTSQHPHALSMCLPGGYWVKAFAHKSLDSEVNSFINLHLYVGP